MSEPVFQAQVIDRDVTDGYWIQAVDVDGDGRPDILTSGPEPAGTWSWYRNPDWQKHAHPRFPAARVARPGRHHRRRSAPISSICHDYARTMFDATPADGQDLLAARTPGPMPSSGNVGDATPIGQLGSDPPAAARALHRLPTSCELLALAGRRAPVRCRTPSTRPIKVTLYRRPGRRARRRTVAR